jgi:hypothetical protein
VDACGVELAGSRVDIGHLAEDAHARPRLPSPVSPPPGPVRSQRRVSSIDS